ncbi:hypothetical protein XENTR_v10012993 [Xenopus tropicalis]|nr:hypothetical protein XENTR_v10012993 [Xenopus tropicalis]
MTQKFWADYWARSGSRQSRAAGKVTGRSLRLLRDRERQKQGSGRGRRSLKQKTLVKLMNRFFPELLSR